jgi:hypothetical protein
MANNTNDSMYIGIDFGKENTLISFFTFDMEEPETVSTVVGKENYLIPMVLAKRKGLGQWYFGNEAENEIRSGNAIEAEDLFHKAVTNDKIFIESEVFEARDLLAIYIKKLLVLPGFTIGNKYNIKAITICTDSVDMSVIETFSSIASKIGVVPQRLYVVDRAEGFYYYVLSQQPDIFRKDVLVFNLEKNYLTHTVLHIDISTRPRIVNLYTENDGQLSYSDRDASFEEIVSKVLHENDISSVYLVGEGFDGDWMQESLQHLLKGRRVFIGKNLYSKGACVSSIVKCGDQPWEYVYIGDNELKINVSLKIYDKNDMGFITLLSAGDNWYEAKGETEVILDGEPSVECWVQRPESRRADVVEITLNDFPKRENRTSRLRISAIPLSDTRVKIKIVDLGFGEITPATNKVWEHEISAEKEE